MTSTTTAGAGVVRSGQGRTCFAGPLGAVLLAGGDRTGGGVSFLVLKPRGIPHAFWNAGDVLARLLEVVTPAGFERYFEKLGEILSVQGPPDLDALAAVAHSHGLEVDPGSVPRLVPAHGLRMDDPS